MRINLDTSFKKLNTNLILTSSATSDGITSNFPHVTALPWGCLEIATFVLTKKKDLYNFLNLL
jgi:hypothetical protein